MPEDAHASQRRIGAYVLAADPTWIRSSLARYYHLLDVLVISASSTGHGWTGAPIRSDECVRTALELDTRGIAVVVRGDWVDAESPMRADTAQRQAALEHLNGTVDWVIQLDTDEVLPSTDALVAALDHADREGVDAVEWPMRVLYRRLRNGSFLAVSGPDGNPRYEYPGAVAVRPSVRLTDARRVEGSFLRGVVVGDAESVQIARAPEPGEIRYEQLTHHDAIVHNSWARSSADVRAKVAAWGHNQGIKSLWYFYGVWLPASWRWRRMRDFHPFARGLWPRLGPLSEDIAALLEPADRAVPGPVRRTAWRSQGGRKGSGSVRG